jgi:hypothetical protein
MEQSTDLQTWMPYDSLPEQLRSYEALAQDFRAQVENRSTSAAGEKFTQFVQKLVPQIEVGSKFNYPILNSKRSNDEGVDLIANGKDGHSVLYIQSKLWVDRAEKIDSVISNFEAYLKNHHTQSSLVGPQYRFDLSNNEDVYFMLVTLSSLKGIVKKYKERPRSSVAFYEQQIARDRGSLRNSVVMPNRCRPSAPAAGSGRHCGSQTLAA